MEYLVAAILLFTPLSFAKEESRQRIIIVDTGINFSVDEMPYLCADGHFDFTGTVLGDINGHGSNIAHIIIPAMNPTTQCITILKWWHNEANYNSRVKNNLAAFFKAIYLYTYALNNVRWINLALSGPEAIEVEKLVLEDMMSTRSTDIVVSAGNEGKNLAKECNTYPACYKIRGPHWFVVANTRKNGEYYPSSNRYGPVNAYQEGKNVTAGGHTMSGTSQAAAKQTAFLVRQSNGKH